MLKNLLILGEITQKKFSKVNVQRNVKGHMLQGANNV